MKKKTQKPALTTGEIMKMAAGGISSPVAQRPIEIMGIGLQAKLGSIIVHLEEACSPRGHQFDAIAVNSLIGDEEVQGWLEKMRRMALLPVKR